MASESANSLRLYAEQGIRVIAPICPAAGESPADIFLHIDYEDFCYPDRNGKFAEILRRHSISPYFTLSDDAANRHILFSVRSLKGNTILHVSDVTSFKDGNRIVPGDTDLIDEEREALTLSITCRPVTATGGGHWDGGISTWPKGHGTGSTGKILRVERKGPHNDSLITIHHFQFNLHCAIVFDGRLIFQA